MKKMLVVLLSVLMALLVCGAGAEEAEQTVYTSGDYQYVLLEDGTAEITGYIGTQKDLTIPDQLAGYTVSAIGYRAFSDDALTSVVIPDSVTKVDGAPFSAPFSDPAMPYRYWDSALTSIHLGAGVTDLLWSSNTKNGFDSLIYPALAHITVSLENPIYCVENGLLIDKTTATLICCPPAMTGRVVVPDWVTAFAERALSAPGLSSVRLPDSLQCSFWSGDVYRRAEDWIYPDAITDERMQHFITDIAKKDARTIQDYYKKIDPINYKKSEDPEQLEAAYPALADGTIVWVLRRAKEDTIEKQATKLESAFAAAGYTADDLAIDYQLVHKAEMPTRHSEWHVLLLEREIVWNEMVRCGIFAGCGLENLPGGQAIAWAAQNDYIPADLVLSGDYFYTVNEDGTACIAAYVGDDSAVTVPATLDGRTVTGIGNEAFIFGSSVTTIALPDSVTQLGETAFACCPGLTDIRLTPDHPTLAAIDGVLFEMSTRTLLCYPEGRMAQSYQVPQGIRRIAPYAFSGRGMLNAASMGYSRNNYMNVESVKQVILPDSVTEIAPRAFYGNTSLTGVTISNGVTAIGDYAFYNCDALENVHIPGNVRSIGARAFSDCDALRTAELAEVVTSIGAYTFAYNGALVEANIPDTVVELGLCVFINCPVLTSVSVGEGVMEIPEGMFAGCRVLTSVTLPEGVTNIGQRAFFNCASLKSMVLPEGLISIGETAFVGCNSLTSITVYRNSYAAQWCKDNNLRYTYPDANDWLLD